MERDHWWFAGKRQIVLRLLKRYIRTTGARARVADLGCGCGMMLSDLSRDYEAVGVDGSPEAIGFCQQRGVDARLCRLPSYVPLARGSFDAVLLLDVLEHLQEDKASARVAVDLLKPDGLLICTVPAHMWLWTERDEHHHHFRRYSRRRFQSLLQQPNLKIELFNHLNSLLFLPAAVGRLWTKLFAKGEVTDLALPPPKLNLLLTKVFASERRFIQKTPIPVGLSFIAVARKLPISESHEAAADPASPSAHPDGPRVA
ncbi:MAG TPA: class I SAM-dependent methyltransferase [Chthoniobacterales bacterium]|nr:class I SAM-dependent methyltransferase [Chthoniobacterales bacterium]